VNFRRFVILAELYGGLKSQEFKHFWEFFAFSGKRPLTVKFWKFYFESFHRDTDRRVVFKFREITRTGNRWNRALLTWQKDRLALQLSLLRGSRPKSARASPRRPTMYSECSRFYPNRFTFGGVIAERLNTAKTRSKVNSIFAYIRAE